MPIRNDVVYSVYQYTDIVGKSYIGLTNDCCRRKNEHRLAKGKSLFHEAIRKYGFDCFQYKRLSNINTLTEAIKLEQKYITEYGKYKLTEEEVKTIKASSEKNKHLAEKFRVGYYYNIPNSDR